jgi:hypothetical protein
VADFSDNISEYPNRFGHQQKLVPKPWNFPSLNGDEFSLIIFIV